MAKKAKTSYPSLKEMRAAKRQAKNLSQESKMYKGNRAERRKTSKGVNHRDLGYIGNWNELEKIYQDAVAVTGLHKHNLEKLKEADIYKDINDPFILLDIKNMIKLMDTYTNGYMADLDTIRKNHYGRVGGAYMVDAMEDVRNGRPSYISMAEQYGHLVDEYTGAMEHVTIFFAEQIGLIEYIRAANKGDKEIREVVIDKREPAVTEEVKQ